MYKEPHTIVVIPSTNATHHVGNAVTDLAYGDLSLLVIPRDETSPAILILKIGSRAAFKLTRDTPFGTLADSTNTYVFAPAGTTGYVKLTLPIDVSNDDSHLSTLRDTFEAVLIHHGLLQDGIEAYADELARSSHEYSTRTSLNITTSTARALKDMPPTSNPVPVDKGLIGALRTGANATQRAALVTGELSGTAGQRAEAAGAWITSQASLSPPPSPSERSPTDFDRDASAPTFASAVSAYRTTTTALAQSSRTLLGAAGGAFAASVAHVYGRDAGALAEEAGRGAMGALGVVGDATSVLSVAWWAERGIFGAADQQEKEWQERA